MSCDRKGLHGRRFIQPERKVYVALVHGNTDAVNIVGDLLDVAVFAGPLNTTQAAQMA